MLGQHPYFEVGNGIFVDMDGEIHRQRPSLDLLSSTSLTPPLTILAGGSGSGPVTGSAPYQSALLAASIAEKTEKLTEKGLKIVAGIVSVVGIADALVQMAELFGLFGEQTDLDDLLVVAKANYAATREGARLSHLQNIAGHMGHVSSSLNDYRLMPVGLVRWLSRY